MRSRLRYFSPSVRSASEKTAPLGECGGAGLLRCAVLEVALGRNVLCGPRHGLRQTSATFACAGIPTLLARLAVLQDSRVP
jgi:hypothetical protein